MKEKKLFKIYNSMSKIEEIFKPKEEGKVGMYVCGVTPYDYSHIGHARAYVAFDVLHRFLKYLNYEVTYVRNFTDIDDKIIKRANEAGKNPLDLSDEFSKEFLKDMAELQCLPPTHEPRVSDHMVQIIDMIKMIIDNGHAYTIDGDVYFSVESFPDYCCLSRRKLDDNRAGGGGRVAVDERKKNPADFALWKSAKPGEPSWESPWGPGRPGWHIECSAMSSHYLGHHFDIHGGGLDLIFPHHENEIAQSRAANPEFKVSYWMHNGFVNKDNQKMSKSENNFFTIRDIIRSFHPLALRYFLMRTHYRTDVNYSDKQLDAASDRVFYLYQTLNDCEVAVSSSIDDNSKSKPSAQAQKSAKAFREEFLESMCDDLHTTMALDKLDNLLKTTNNTFGTLVKAQDKIQQLQQQDKNNQQPQKQLQQLLQQQQSHLQDLVIYEKEIKDAIGVLGLIPSSTWSEVLMQLKEKAVERAGLTEEKIQEMIADRTSFRQNKEYQKSDDVRLYLSKKGIALMDEIRGPLKGTTTWRPVVYDPTKPEFYKLIDDLRQYLSTKGLPPLEEEP